MDSFSIIQNFFTRMTCNFCSQPFEPDGIELIREERGVYIVGVYCHACERQIGVAMVGLELQGEDAHDARFKDPELTEEELERLSKFSTITYNDVHEAHEFFKGLEGDWMKFIPEEIRERCIDSDTE